MRGKKLSLRRLFSNTKFLILFSIAVAFIFWIVVALEYAPIVETDITDVPVKIEMENSVPDKLGLQIFGQKEYTVDITVRGNRYVVGGSLLSASDFEVTAQTAYVNSAGHHSLQLKITKTNADADYEIVSTSEDYIDVYFDKYEEKEFEVTPRIVTELDSLTADGYTFSEKDIIVSIPTVTLSGAKTEMDKVQTVYADINIDSPLKVSETYESELLIYNGTEEVSQYISINGESQLKVPVTLPVYKVMTLPTAVTFKNAPGAYINNPLSYVCTPSSAKVAVLQNGSTSDKQVNVGVVDFTKLTKNSHVFNFSASSITDVKVLDGTDSFRVNVDVDGITSGQLTLSQKNVTAFGYAEDASVKVSLRNTGSISVSGEESAVDALTDDSVYGKIDLNNVELTEEPSRIAMTVYVKDSDSCWVTGNYYAEVSVTE